MESLPLSARRAAIRLAIVVLLSLLIASACYGVSLSPVSQAMVSTSGGRPAGRGPGNPAARPSATTSDGVSTDSAANASASAGSGNAASQAPPMTRPAGGGRPASLSRGLPELALNVGIIAVLILTVSVTQVWLRTRRRPRSRRSV